MKEKHQRLLLSPTGIITTSEGNILPEKAVLHYSSIQLFPFIESIFSDLYKSCVEEASQVYFQKVIRNHVLLPGYYDYRFSGQKRYLLWEIRDQTERYQQLQYRLQELNEWKIEK